MSEKIIFLIGSLFMIFSAYCTAAENLQLQLPPAIYAVPGVEMNVYFDNIVMTVNPGNYVFDVNCSKGRNGHKRWRFTPASKDVGTYVWELKVISDKGVVASGKTKLIVVPENAGKDKNLSLLSVTFFRIIICRSNKSMCPATR